MTLTAIGVCIALFGVWLLATFVPATVTIVVRTDGYCPGQAAQCSFGLTFREYPMNYTWDSHVSLHWWANTSGPVVNVTVTNPLGAIVYTGSGSRATGQFYIPHESSHAPYVWSIDITESAYQSCSVVLYENQTVWNPPWS